VKERAECFISEVAITGEAVSHLVVFAREPLGEQHGRVVEQEFCGSTSNPQSEGCCIKGAVIKTRPMEPACGGGAIGASEDDRAGRDAGSGGLEG
jgi:hypothetical protein